jgi:hypothetical protein
VWLFLGAISRRYGFQLFDGHFTVPTAHFTRTYHALIGFLSSFVGWFSEVRRSAFTRPRSISPPRARRASAAPRPRFRHVRTMQRAAKKKNTNKTQSPENSQNLLLFAINTLFFQTQTHAHTRHWFGSIMPSSDLKPTRFFRRLVILSSDISLICFNALLLSLLLSSAPSDPSDPIGPYFLFSACVSSRTLNSSAMCWQKSRIRRLAANASPSFVATMPSTCSTDTH